MKTGVALTSVNWLSSGAVMNDSVFRLLSTKKSLARVECVLFSDLRGFWLEQHHPKNAAQIIMVLFAHRMHLQLTS
jgi:hypothetical protein